MLGAHQEIEDDLAVGEVPDLTMIGGREPSDDRCKLRRPPPPQGLLKRLMFRNLLAERLAGAGVV